MKRIPRFLAAVVAVSFAGAGSFAAETPVPISGVTVSLPVAMVFNPLNDHIYVLDTVSTGAFHIYGFVHVIDAATNTYIRTLQMGEESKGLTVDGYRNKIYVTNGIGNSINVIDGVTDQLLTDGSGNVKTIPLRVGPAAIAFSYYDGYTYVSYHDPRLNAPAVAVIDGGSDTIVGTVTGFAKEISGLLWPVYGSLSHLMFAVGGGTPATLYSISTFGGSGSIARAIDVGNVPGPSASIYRPMGGENSRSAVYVANSPSNTVTEFEYPNTTTTIAVPAKPVSIAGEDHWATGGGHVYVACQDADTVVEITGHAVTRTWTGLRKASSLQYDPRNHCLYVAGYRQIWVLHI